MNEDIAAQLLQLVALLQEEYSPVEWEQAAELLIDFPDGDYLLSRLRYQNIPPLSFFFGSFGSRPESIDPCLPPDKRKALLRAILPYALLLDLRYTALERACLIQDAGYDAVKFCEAIIGIGNRYYGDRRFGDAASEALLVIAEHQNLLRGSQKPDIPASELLRAAQTGAVRDDSLLHPAESPPVMEQRPGLLARFKRRKFFVKG